MRELQYTHLIKSQSYVHEHVESFVGNACMCVCFNFFIRKMQSFVFCL
jgi:hypothetical protein